MGTNTIPKEIVMKKVYVENSAYMEFICEVATQIVIQRFGEDTFINTSEGTKFRDEPQDFFNEQYDEVETLTNKIMRVYGAKEGELKEGGTFLTMGYLISNLIRKPLHQHEKWNKKINSCIGERELNKLVEEEGTREEMRNLSVSTEFRDRFNNGD